MTNDFPETEGAYQPVSCARYAELELAILRRSRLRLAWRVGNVFHLRLVSPYDLRTHKHEEFLLCRGEAGTKLIIRLDRIRSMVRL